MTTPRFHHGQQFTARGLPNKDSSYEEDERLLTVTGLTVDGTLSVSIEYRDLPRTFVSVPIEGAIGMVDAGFWIEVEEKS